jgi:AraC-like DNA-binding protein
MEAVERVQDWAFGRPAPPLTPFVAGYQGYRLAGMPPARHAGLPSPFLTLILSLHEPLVVAAHPDPGQPGGSYRTLVGGLHTRPALITHDGAQSGVQICLDPLGARTLVGVPAGELAELDVDADAVVGGVAERAREQMLAARSWPARFAVLDRLLLERLRAADAELPAPEVVHAWRRLRTSRGRVRVDALTAETGWSARHLAAMMRREVGLPPKAAARVVRFDRARRLLAGGGWRVADVAAAAGYADQSHLDRDFRQFAGAPPSRWLAEEVRNVQVPPPEQLAASMP